MEWSITGLFEEIWRAVLQKYNELKEIGREWQSADDCMIKAPLAREAVEHAILRPDILISPS
jgi:hypothetical protein